MERPRIAFVLLSAQLLGSKQRMKHSVWEVPGGRALTAILLTVLCLEERFCENDPIDSPIYFFSKAFISN